MACKRNQFKTVFQEQMISLPKRNDIDIPISNNAKMKLFWVEFLIDCQPCPLCMWACKELLFFQKYVSCHPCLEINEYTIPKLNWVYVMTGKINE